MNTDPDARTVLCFGDSNTYGQRAEDVDKGRWPVDIRWTGLLQRLLGDGYAVVEEGLNGRTIELDEQRPGRNGRAYLIPCLESQHPVDILVLGLGFNDLKPQFRLGVPQVAASLNRLLDEVDAAPANWGGRPPRVVLLAPLPIDDTRPGFHEFFRREVAPELIVRSHALAAAVRDLAAERGLGLVDLGSVAKTGDDGIHLSVDSHPAVAAAVAGEIRAG
ncbi:GDSL-type esterase/lipase family protein [Actinoplanes sp. CA-142083]|uniref:GDSL-type esterase/lipase family protein n=1 Tax=Actinoplanes sp. CA-142083 TaxID=3239903 RepID=UPI003D9474FB